MASVPTHAARPLSTPIPPTRDLADFLAFIYADGALKRGLSTAEQRTLEARQRHIAGFMIAAPADAIKTTIAQCFLGLGYAPDKAEAQMMATQYVTVLSDLPLWAIEQACMRFARGDVQPDELDQKDKVNFERRPSTAQLYKLARRVASPFAAESMQIASILKAPVLRALNEEDRAHADASIKKWQSQQGDLLSEKDVERRREFAAEIDRLHRDRVLREYTTAGLEPPEERPGKMLVSLPLLLSMGCSIVQTPGGRKVLAYPERPEAPPPPAPEIEERHQRAVRGAIKASQAVRRVVDDIRS